MAEFNEDISQIARETGLNITEVEELIAEATGKHLEVLAEIYGKVPKQAQPAIEKTMANLMIQHQKRVQVLEQRGGWGSSTSSDTKKDTRAVGGKNTRTTNGMECSRRCASRTRTNLPRLQTLI